MAAYRNMINKENAEIAKINEQIQQKERSIRETSNSNGSTPGTTANVNWEDSQGSSGKKFKFIHVIVVSIVFLLLGSYLAKLPIAVSTDQASSDG